MPVLMYCENADRFVISDKQEDCKFCGNHTICRHAILSIDKIVVGKAAMPGQEEQEVEA